jgi:lipoate-protein ligase B
LQIAGEVAPALLFVEHPPTITIGRRGDQTEVVAPRKVLEARGITVTETDRGGQVTYHGPGQIVAYPLVDLQALRLGLHEYMRALEEATIRTIDAWGIKGYRVEDRTGVWVGKEKVCAMGIRVRRWWTIHGLALNVTTNLNHFGMIVPCGIRDRGVTSLERILGAEACPSVDAVKVRLREALGEVLGLEFSRGPLDPAVLSPAGTA